MTFIQYVSHEDEHFSEFVGPIESEQDADFVFDALRRQAQTFGGTVGYTTPTSVEDFRQRLVEHE
jgi:hypothetical protein